MEEVQRDQLFDQQEVIVDVKWGTDAWGGLPLYKQRGEGLGQDGSCFVAALVPLQITSLGDGPVAKSIWANPRPNSFFWCRPIRFKYTKETKEVVTQERDYVKGQFDGIVNSVVVVDGKELRVKYNACMTMVDGKVANTIAECPSGMRCNMCSLTSRQFNNLEVVNRARDNIREDVLDLGLSPLHAWIRSLEWVLHLAYRHGINKCRT